MSIFATTFAILLMVTCVYAQNSEPRKNNPMIAPQFTTTAAETIWVGYVFGRHPSLGSIQFMDTTSMRKLANFYAQAIIREGNSLSFDPTTTGKRVTLYNSDTSGRLDAIWDDGGLTVVATRTDSNGFGLDYIYGLTTSIFSRSSIVPVTNGLYDLGSREAGILLGGPHQFRNGYFSDTVYTAKFFMPTGASSNYIMVSNADGFGTWQDISGIVGDTVGILHRSDSTWLQVDSVRISHFTDSLINAYQNVWKRTSGGIVTLVNSGDSVVVGGAWNASLSSKLQIPVSNTLFGLAFTQAAGASIDAPIMQGLMNNNDLWKIEHLAGDDSWRLAYWQFPGGTTPVYLSMNSIGFGINAAAQDLFNIGGNASVGGFNSAMTGSTNFRIKGGLYAGIQGAEVNTLPGHYFEQSAGNMDIVTFSDGIQTDSLTSGKLMVISKNLSPFTSASAQTVWQHTLNYNTTYNWDLTAIMRPTNKTGEYFSKRIYVTASNDSGTVVFDTTMIARHARDPFGVFGTCDFVVSAAGNVLSFQVLGSASNGVHYIVTGTRSFTK